MRKLLSLVVALAAAAGIAHAGAQPPPPPITSTAGGVVTLGNATKSQICFGVSGQSCGITVNASGDLQKVNVYTTGTLPTCNAAEKGIHVFVSNGAASPTYMATNAGGGSVFQQMMCNGSQWVND